MLKTVYIYKTNGLAVSSMATFGTSKTQCEKCVGCGGFTLDT